MRLNKEEIKIPTTQNCVFAIRLDTETEQEHILIGELKEVQGFLAGGDNKLLVNEKRPFGSFILECSTPIANQLADVRVALSDSIGKRKTPYFENSKKILEGLWNSDNLIYRFIAVRIWQEYKMACKTKNYDLYSEIEKTSLPLMFSLAEDIKTWQENDPQNPLYQLDSVYFSNPALAIYSAKGVNEYYTTKDSLFPIIVYYLKTVYNEKTYIQSCKLCGKLFRANTANIPTFCSAKCKREQGKINKRRFDKKAKQTPSEMAYKKQYMFCYNRIQKLRKNASDSELLSEAEKMFKVFRKEALRLKKQVQNGSMTDTDFENWMFQEVGKFEEKLNT